MAEYQIVVDGFLNEPLTGRRPIETPETEINQANVLKVVMGKADPIHISTGISLLISKTEPPVRSL